jgi:hypothetical protein
MGVGGHSADVDGGPYEDGGSSSQAVELDNSDLYIND